MNNLSLIHRNLHKVTFGLDRQAEQMLQKRFGLTFSQFRMLAAIHHTKRLCQAEIAAFHGLTAAAVSRQIEFLAEKKLIAFNRVPENRRQRLLVLTEKGRRLTGKAMEAVDGCFGTQYRKLSLAEQSIFSRALQKLTGYMADSQRLNNQKN